MRCQDGPDRVECIVAIKALAAKLLQGRHDLRNRRSELRVNDRVHHSVQPCIGQGDARPLMVALDQERALVFVEGKPVAPRWTDLRCVGVHDASVVQRACAASVDVSIRSSCGAAAPQLQSLDAAIGSKRRYTARAEGTPSARSARVSCVTRAALDGSRTAASMA